MQFSKPASASRTMMLAACAMAVFVGFSTPAMAQDDVTQDNTSIGDVMLTPLTDLNLAKDPIPPVLVRAYHAPYDDIGLSDCRRVGREIGNLDAVLGEDFDTPRAEREGTSPETMAQKVLGGFIPFRGVIRHLSGANRREYEFREAITAGLMRRAYLKGLGQAMGCAYPARPAPPGLMVNAGDDELTVGEEIQVGAD